MSDIHPDVARVLITAEEIKAKLMEMGESITEHYRGKNPVVVCVLKGAIYVVSDLTRFIDTDVEIDFMVVSSYGTDTKSSGVVRIVKDLNTSLCDRHVLVVEDIIDTGLTLKYLLRNFAARGAASIEVAALLWKTGAQEIDIDAKWVGFEIPNEFVIGYGLDYAEKYRNLPYVGVIKQEAVGAE